MGDKFTELLAFIQGAKRASYELPRESVNSGYGRANALIRTKLDEARLWVEEARRLEQLRDGHGEVG